MADRDTEWRMQTLREEFAAGRLTEAELERNVEEVLRCAAEGRQWRGVPYGPLDREAPGDNSA